MAQPFASLPSSATYQEKRDVFLSFRGEDTRDGFTSHLYAALEKAKIQTFMDNDGLKRGDVIAPSLQKGIEESKVSVVVLSINYANSGWCLNELLHILECEEKYGQIVIPVFYKTDPTDVRHQTNSYKEAFDKLKKRNNDEQIQKWRDALNKAADHSGWTIGTVVKDEDSDLAASGNSSVGDKDKAIAEASSKKKATRIITHRQGSESESIELIVKDILKKLNRMSPVECSNLVGIDSRVKEIQSLLKMNDSQSVGIIGIWGMGGSGKTAIAGALFNQIYMQFEGFHFLPNVSEELKRRNEADLRNKIISNILEENLNLNTPNLEQAFVKDRLRRKNVLLVLDDVDDSVPLQNLLGEPNDLFGRGSRIIITSRDRRVLKSVTNYIYEVPRLEFHEALELFSLSAFKAKDPPSDYLQMSRSVIDYTNCNPLALKVLGSALFKLTKEEWQSKLEKLDSDPQIQNMTRISYEGLTSDQKGIFLDIACFFEGEERDYVTKILEPSYSSVHYNIGVLIDKSLVTMSNNKIEMHDLVQQMGWNIVHEAEPGKRSRLWTYDQLCDALKEEKGNEAVEGIVLDICEPKGLKLKSDSFKKMDHLRLLKFYVPGSSMGCNNKVNIHGGHLTIPGKLTYLHWHGYPLKYLPNDFCAENLVELRLPFSNLQELPLGNQDLPNLKWIDLRNSEYLYNVSGLSGAVKLESLVLQGCTGLTNLDQSIQYLQKLKHIDLGGCEELGSFPRRLESKCVQFLDLSYCCNIRDCPEISGLMEELDLSWTAIKELHPSIQQLKYLKVLRLNGCSNITKFPVTSESIEELYLSETAINGIPSSINLLTRLVKLDVGNCRKLSHLAHMFTLESLKEVQKSGTTSLKNFAVHGQENLKSIPGNLYNFAGLPFRGASQAKEEFTSKTKGLVSGIPGVGRIKGYLPEFSSKEVPDCSKTAKETPIEAPDESKSKGLLSGIPRVLGGSKTKGSFPKDPDNLGGKIPDDLGGLLSLKHLILKRMDFESLPSSIKQLSQLQFIDLSRCKKLKSLPELPPSLEMLDADNCSSLQSLFSSSNFKYLDLENCRNLDQKTQKEIIDNVQSIIQRMARKSREEGYPVQFLFPGNEMPPLFYDHTNVGSSVSIKWPSNWTKFNGIVFCMLFGPEEGSTILKKVNEATLSPKILSFGCKCCIKANDGSTSSVICEWERNFGHLSLAKSDHVLTWYDPCRKKVEGGSDEEIEWFKKYSGRKVSFEFHIETFLCFSNQCTVKKCGIILLQNEIPDSAANRLDPRMIK